MKKKKVIILICVICIALVRIFTPYLGKPFLIYCDRGGKGEKERFHLSNKVKEIHYFALNEPYMKFTKYCTELETLCVTSLYDNINIDDVANPNLKNLFLYGKCDNFSTLNECTELQELSIYDSNLTTIEEISELKKLEILHIQTNEELSLKKLNEQKNITELSINCPNGIGCEDLSQLKKLETLRLYSDGEISGLDKIDSVKFLVLYPGDKDNPCDIDCEDLLQMNNLEKLHLKTNGKILGIDKIESVKSLTLCPENKDNPCDIDCKDLLQMKNLEELTLSTYGKISGLDKMDTVKSLTISYSNEISEEEICDMDSLKEIRMINSDYRFSDKAILRLRDKGVSISEH